MSLSYPILAPLCVCVRPVSRGKMDKSWSSQRCFDKDEMYCSAIAANCALYSLYPQSRFQIRQITRAGHSPTLQVFAKYSVISALPKHSGSQVSQACTYEALTHTHGMNKLVVNGNGTRVFEQLEYFGVWVFAGASRARDKLNNGR